MADDESVDNDIAMLSGKLETLKVIGQLASDDVTMLTAGPDSKTTDLQEVSNCIIIIIYLYT